MRFLFFILILASGFATHAENLCVLDIGSNNVKLNLAAYDRVQMSVRPEVVDRVQLGLGDALTAGEGVLSPVTTEKLVKAINSLKEVCAKKGDGAQVAAAIATEWIRQCKNADEVVAEVAQATGIKIRPISGNEEARFGYLAAVRGVPGEAVVDSGSRSFQLTFGGRGNEGQLELLPKSLPLGYQVMGAELAANPGEFASVRISLKDKIKNLLGEAGFSPALGVKQVTGLSNPAMVGAFVKGFAKGQELSHDERDDLAEETMKGDAEFTIRREDLSAALAQIDAYPLEQRDTFLNKHDYTQKLVSYMVLYSAILEQLGADAVTFVPREMSWGVHYDLLRAPVLVNPDSDL